MVSLADHNSFKITVYNQISYILNTLYTCNGRNREFQYIMFWIDVQWSVGLNFKRLECIVNPVAWPNYLIISAIGDLLNVLCVKFPMSLTFSCVPNKMQMQTNANFHMTHYSLYSKLVLTRARHQHGNSWKNYHW